MFQEPTHALRHLPLDAMLLCPFMKLTTDGGADCVLASNVSRQPDATLNVTVIVISNQIKELTVELINFDPEIM